ncbi:class I SAM-dependent methyltransferase [Devosia faecipullorum]|uniref:class I SAM-dependent methyltransferase n=1 Tax=Devosia faecipullorum TaxID=2755039 RepID=UPI00187B23AF|nr:class I SAM-dependent methyltransferase [Devosia faecipullorum]MBE7733261.1 class I SAM-dependent methyltransferase [Devosia faecipullorum]
MANSSSTGAGALGKSYPHPFQTEAPSLIDGMVQHALVSPSIQVQILSIVDETGSATIGDITDELPDHPDPVGAVMVMVGLKILVLDPCGVLDAHTLVRRADPEPDPDGAAGPVSKVPGGSGSPIVSSAASAIPVGMEHIEVSPFRASLVVGSERRAFARMEKLRRPGIYGLVSASAIYIGMGGDTGLRIASGQQPIENIDTIFAITDANGNLSTDDARVAERILWSRAKASRERVVINGVPDGIAVDPQRYSEIDAFVAQACLALRHAGILFTQGSARSVLAGPRTEPGRVAPLRPLNNIPDGEILELCFGDGLVALAARHAEDRWTLLQGSDVRPEAVASANASTRYLRASWLHSGLLAASPDGRSFVVKRDLVFASGSAVSQFCCGAKGRGLASWKPIDPDGGYDPNTAALIAG